MINLIGTYECKADEKGRIMLPVSLKKQLSDKLKNGFVIKMAKIHRLPIYPHEYGAYIWQNEKEQILNKAANENNWNVGVMPPFGHKMEFDDINAVLSANVYSCAMDYFLNRKWIENTNDKNDDAITKKDEE